MHRSSCVYRRTVPKQVQSGSRQLKKQKKRQSQKGQQEGHQLVDADEEKWLFLNAIAHMLMCRQSTVLGSLMRYRAAVGRCWQQAGAWGKHVTTAQLVEHVVLALSMCELGDPLQPASSASQSQTGSACPCTLVYVCAQ